MERSIEAQAKRCCADLYQSSAVRWLLGDTLHPGGLAPTNRLGQLLGITPESRVVDVGCGRGSGSQAVARRFGCHVVGVDMGRRNLVEGSRPSETQEMNGRVAWVVGDGEELPLASQSCHYALCECTLSLFPDKASGLAEIWRVLREGGKLGLSDVTVEPGCLSGELEGSLGQVLCLSDALPVDGYRDLLTSAGFSVTHQEDASEHVLKLLEEIEGKLAAIGLLRGLPIGLPGDEDVVSKAQPLINKVKELVREGKIGYWLFVAEKG